MILKYNLHGNEAFLTGYSAEDEGYLTVMIDGCSGGVLSIGNAAAKTENGVGRVKLSAIKDGFHIPRVSSRNASVRLLPVKIKNGVCELSDAPTALAALGAVTFSLLERAKKTEAELEALKAAVFGTKIF